MEFHHTSVLLHETVDSLKIRPDGIYVDGTLGGGGHAEEVLRHLTGGGRLIGIDQDEAAIEAAGKRLSAFGSQVTIVRDNYVNMPEILRNLGIAEVDGIYLDLGVSSYQFDNGDRGFSYRVDAPLDMRMDQKIVSCAEQRPEEREQRADQSLDIPPTVAVIPESDLRTFEQQEAADVLNQCHADGHAKKQEHAALNAAVKPGLAAKQCQKI